MTAAAVSGPDPLIDDILGDWRTELGPDRDAYRNHVQRVFHLTRHRAPDADPRTLAVAAAFHDLGIWSDRTFDYLEPSVARAAGWLRDHGDESRLEAVAATIRNHHKLTAYRGPHGSMVEAFRRADLADVSMGLIGAGPLYRGLRRQFPYCGFHRRLLQLGRAQLLRHPLRPLPMLRW